MPISVSIVEDNSHYRESLSALLDQDADFRCVSDHGNAEEAPVEVPRLRPDVLLMDINLPGINGVECLRQFKQQSPQTETALQNTEQIFTSLAAGAVDYLLKQTPLEELLEAIKVVHGGGSPMDSRVARKVVQHFQTAKPKQAGEEVEKLSPRERQILDLPSKGCFYREIVKETEISYSTVHTCIRQIYKKLQVRFRAEAVTKRLGTAQLVINDTQCDLEGYSIRSRTPKKTNRKTPMRNNKISLVAILFAVFSFIQTLSATVIYQDTFSGAAASLDGRVPDTVSNGTNWASPVTPQFAVDGGGNGTLSAAVPNASANNAAGPTLPFTPDGSSTYALSVDVNGFGDVNANHWMTLGFSATNSGLSWFTANNGGRAEILIRPQGVANGSVGTYGGSNATVNGISFNSENAIGTYTLILNSATGDVIYETPNKILRIYTLTPAEVASIRSVQLAAGQGTPVGLVYDNFILQTTNISLPLVAPVLITGTTTATLPMTTNVYSGTTVSLTSAASGSGPLNYNWVTDNGSGGASWTSIGSNSTTLVVDTTALTAGTYQYAFVCSNSFGSVTSAAPASLTITVSAPALSSDISPTNRTSYTGKAAKFGASFTGSLPLSYTWLYSPNPDGSGAVAVTNLTTITNSSILLSNLTLSEAGYYSLQASNSLGTVNSSWAHLNVLNSTLQTNGLWIDSFSRVGALNGTAADVTNSASTWSAIGNWTTTGSEGLVTGISSGNSGKLSVFPITLVPGKVYQVSVEDLTLTGTGTSWMGLGFFSSNSSNDTAFAKSVAFLLFQVDGFGQTFFGDPGLNNGSGKIAGTGGIGEYAVRLTVLASGAAIVEFVRNGVVFRTGSLTSAQVANIAGVGLTALSGVSATFDNFRVENLPFPAPPTVGTPTLSPSSTVYAGTPVTVNITSGGQAPLFYQWQTDNGSGGTSFSNTGGNSTNLLVDTTSLSGAYQYQVIVTNNYGSVTSAPVTLTVYPASAPFVTKDTRPICTQDVPVGQA